MPELTRVSAIAVAATNAMIAEEVGAKGIIAVTEADAAETAREAIAAEARVVADAAAAAAVVVPVDAAAAAVDHAKNRILLREGKM